VSEFEDKLGAILNDQQAMGQIMALARSLSGESSGQETNSLPERAGQKEETVQEKTLFQLPAGLDPGLVQTGIRLVQEYNRTDDRAAALLEALRPFVREERYSKVDRAVQIARLTRVIRVVFDTMRENGGPFHV